MTTDPTLILSHALATASAIAPVIPIHGIQRDLIGRLACTCRKTDCGRHTGKHPVEIGWQAMATRDTEAVREWFEGRYRGYNYGVMADEKLPVLDPDIRPGTGRDGVAELNRIVSAAGGSLPHTRRIITGSGSEH